MKHFLFNLLMITSLFVQGQKQQYIKVIDSLSQSPVHRATIEFADRQVISTDDEGRFFINRSSATVFISAIGYESKTVSTDQISGSIVLSPKPIQLTEVSIAGNPMNHFEVIGKIDIGTRQVNSSQEILRLVPGLFIGQHAGGGKAEQIFMRGFDIDHGTDIQITVDDMPVNMVSHAHGQGYADLHFVIPELIENVSFKKGPYYADKGNFSTTGHVNFRTIDVLKQNNIKAESGLFDTYRLMGAVNLLPENIRSKQSAYIAGEYMYTNGYFDAPQNFNRVNLFGKYNGNINEQNLLSVSASVFSSRWDASGQIPERAVNSGQIGYFGAIDSNEGGETSRKNLNVLLSSSLKNGAVLKNRLMYSRYEFELFSNFTFFKADPVNGDQIKQKEKRDLLAFNSSYDKIFFAGDKKVNSEIGFNIRNDRTKDSELSRTKNRKELLERIRYGDINETNVGAFVNATIYLNSKLNIQAGLRADHFIAKYLDKIDPNETGKANASIVSPKLNINFQLNKKTQVYFSLGRGFHSNDTRAVVSRKGLEILPGAWGSDLGFVVKPVSNLYINAALWYLKMEQEFVYVGDEGIVEPSGKSERYGVDFTIRYEPFKWLMIDGDINFARPRSIEEPKGSDFIPLAPNITATSGITSKFGKGFQASLRNRFMGDRAANEDKSTIAKGYFVNDLYLNLNRNKLEYGITIQNLFDVKWKETQFDTESRFRNEPSPVSEIHFTPGTRFFVKASVNYKF